MYEMSMYLSNIMHYVQHGIDTYCKNVEINYENNSTIHFSMHIVYTGNTYNVYFELLVPNPCSWTKFSSIMLVNDKFEGLIYLQIG